ncbi:MAG: prepilin-type N-terminal cleavage/methylation domain-containing protein [Eubacteriales bacterium]
MKLTKKKAFTLVELLIVIAILAILATVSIIGYTSFIDRANESVDTQLIHQLNTAVLLKDSEPTMQAALNAAIDAGFDVAKINARAENNKILWDSANEVFCYLDGDSLVYVPETNKVTPEKWELWEIVTDASAVATSEHSVYWNGGAVDALTVNGVGFDAGTSSVASVTYNGASEARNVVVRTNSEATTLNITVYESADKSQSDTVSVYGLTGLIDVQKGGSHSVHSYGYVGFVTVREGKFLAKGGEVEATYLPDVDNASANEDGGSIGSVYVIGEEDKENAQTNVAEENVHYLYDGTSTDATEIENAIESTINNLQAEAQASVLTTAAENGFSGITGSIRGVARIGSTGYETLADAIAAASTDKTVIVLLQDINLSAPLAIGKDQNITINLNGYGIYSNLKGGSSKGSVITNSNTNAVLSFVGTGTIESTYDSSSYGPTIYSSKTLSIGKNVTVKGVYTGIKIGGGTATISGTVVNTKDESYISFQAPIQVSSGTVMLQQGAVVTGTKNSFYVTSGVLTINTTDLTGEIRLDGTASYDPKLTITEAINTMLNKGTFINGLTKVSDDDEYYHSIRALMYKGNNGKTVTMLSDYFGSGAIPNASYSDVHVTLDTNGHSYTTTARAVVYVQNSGSLTITNSSPTRSVLTASGEPTSKTSAAAAWVYDNCTLTIGENVSLEQTHDSGIGVILWGANPVFNLQGGTVEAQMYGVTGNGSSTTNSTISITSGTIKGGAAGIYHPESGNVNVSGGSIIGGVGIQMCSGTLNMTGGTIKGGGTDNRATKTGDGLIPDGAAISIVNRAYPGGAPSATISGATVTGGILAYTWSNNTVSEEKNLESVDTSKTYTIVYDSGWTGLE